jgi:hypothetical protein
MRCIDAFDIKLTEAMLTSPSHSNCRKGILEALFWILTVPVHCQPDFSGIDVVSYIPELKFFGDHFGQNHALYA